MGLGDTRYMTEQYEREQRRNEEEAKHRQRMREIAQNQLRDSNLVVINAQKLSTSLAPKSDMRRLVDALSAYLKKRIAKETPENMNFSEIENRTKFVSACLGAISEKDQQALDALLVEEKIKKFKGILSKKLYNIAKPFQFFSEKRKAEIAKGAPVLAEVRGAPSARQPILQIIGEYDYDKGMHCDLDPNAPVVEEKGADIPPPSRCSIS